MQNKVFLLLIFAKIDRKSMKKWKKFLDRPIRNPSPDRPVASTGCISDMFLSLDEKFLNKKSKFKYDIYVFHSKSLI